MKSARHMVAESERDNKIIKKYVIYTLLLLLIVVICAILYVNNREDNYIGYTESGDIDYKVFLTENDFYEEKYLEENQQYVSSLIKNIVADFKYDMKTSEDIDSNYTYKIDAIININDSNNKKLIYKHKETLLEEKNLTNADNNISINENVEINFNHFNSIAKNFVDTYKLPETTESTLNINLVIKTDKTEETTISLDIPLTKQTISISTNTAFSDESARKIIVSGNNEQVRKATSIVMAISIACLAFIVYNFMEYVIETRTDESIYKSEVRKILLNYGEYINKTQDFQFKLDEYEIIRLQTFVDLIKIKEDLSRPIFMIENKEKTNTIFAITDNTKYMYVFALNLHQELLTEKNEEHKDVGVWSNDENRD